MSRGKKIICRIGLGLLIAIVALIIFVGIFTGTEIEKSVEIIGSSLTKSKVSIEDVSFWLLRGKLTINNMVIHNPEGFKTEYAFSLTKVHVDIDTWSLFTKKIHINEIEIEGPAVIYEAGLGESNVGVILKNMQRFTPEKTAEEKAEAKAKAKEKAEAKRAAEEAARKEAEARGEEYVPSGKSMQIDHLVISGAKMKVATKIGGFGVPVPLPNLEMNDLGKNEDISGADISVKVMKSMVKNIGSSVGNIGNSIKDTFKDKKFW